MSNADRNIAYTVKTGTRDGLLEAIGDLAPAPGEFEVILYPHRGGDYSLRTETEPGMHKALADLHDLNSAVVRVFVEGSE